MDKDPNARIRELSGVAKYAAEGISAMWKEWRMTGSLRGSMWKCAGSRSVGRPRKRWIDTMKKSGLDVREARRMVQARNVWRGFVGRFLRD